MSISGSHKGGSQPGKRHFTIAECNLISSARQSIFSGILVGGQVSALWLGLVQAPLSGQTAQRWRHSILLHRIQLSLYWLFQSTFPHVVTDSPLAKFKRITAPIRPLTFNNCLYDKKLLYHRLSVLLFVQFQGKDRHPVYSLMPLCQQNTYGLSFPTRSLLRRKWTCSQMRNSHSCILRNQLATLQTDSAILPGLEHF